MRKEVSRPVPVRSLGAGEADGRTERVVQAEPAELPEVARRLQVPSVGALRCRFALSAPDRDGAVLAEGVLDAQVERICVASLDPFVETVSDAFALRFVPEPRTTAAEDDAGAMDPDEIDELFYADGMIDLGEAMVEQLALCLHPYPRRPGAETVPEPEAPEDGTDGGRTNPFAVLAARNANRH